MPYPKLKNLAKTENWPGPPKPGKSPIFLAKWQASLAWKR